MKRLNSTFFSRLRPDHSCARECLRVDASEESIVDCTLLNLFRNDGIRDMGDDTLSKSMKHKKKKLKVMGFGKIASSIGGKPPNEDKNVLLQPSKATLAV